MVRAARVLKDWWRRLREPDGYTLMKLDGERANRIRGDMIPPGTAVILYGGRSFVDTGKKDDQGFLVYAEGHLTHEYKGWD